MKSADAQTAAGGSGSSRRARRSEIVVAARSENRRALAYLRDLIEDSDLLQRQIEDRLGLSRDYVSRLLNGYVELKVRHLESLFEVLDLSPAQFFGELFPRPRPRPVRRRRTANLKVNKDVIKVYSYGIASVRELSRRLERCEKIIAAVARSTTVEALLRSKRDRSEPETARGMPQRPEKRGRRGGG